MNGPLDIIYSYAVDQACSVKVGYWTRQCSGIFNDRTRLVNERFTIWSKRELFLTELKRKIIS